MLGIFYQSAVESSVYFVVDWWGRSKNTGDTKILNKLMCDWLQTGNYGREEFAEQTVIHYR